jgi:glutamate synthase domain-containing protein 2
MASRRAIKASSNADSIRDSQAQSADAGRFGVDLEAQIRHEKLKVKIAQLERQAQRAKNTEAAAAIRWIKKAIKDYGIDAREIGL